MDLKRPLATLALLVLLAGCADGESASTAPAAEPAPQSTAAEQRDDPARVPLDDADREARSFLDRLPRCTTLAQALELALASECVDEAYAGVEESALVVIAAVDVVAASPACRAPLRDFLRRLRRFAEWAGDTTAAGRNRQFFDFNTLAAQARRQASRYERARARVAGCPPKAGG